MIAPDQLARWQRVAPFWISLALLPLAWISAAQGGWSVLLLVMAVAWIALLYLGITGDHSHTGAFLGWFGYALMLVAMLSFNVGLLWQRSNMRRRRRSSRRGEPAAV